MKKLATILALLAFTIAPVFAADNTPLIAPLDFAAASPACSSATASSVPSAQYGELPSWLTSDPLFLSEVLAAGCASYCADCGGCCAILGPGMCACC